jgi:hypothetical protein
MSDILNQCSKINNNLTNKLRLINFHELFIISNLNNQFSAVFVYFNTFVVELFKY